MKKIAVLGTGNIAQTVAVDLKSNGHEVRLFAPDYLISRIQKIVDTHEIECVGVFEAKEKIDVVTSDIDEAVKGADYIILCVPGNRHEEYARILKGHTTAQQILITFNGCMVSLIYKNVWEEDASCPIFAESTIPPFSARRVEPGKVRMFERHLAPIAFFPAAAAEKYYDQIRKDVYDFPSNLFVAKFLGTPPINVFHGFVKDQTLFIGKNAVLATPGVSDQEVTAGIRPEGLIYRPDGPLSCHMNRIEVMGRDTSITASHPDCKNPVIRAITNTDKLPDPGARTVSFSLKPGKVHLFQAETGERIPFSTNHEVNSYE